MVEITTRTLHSRMLLRPSTALREIMIGILGRAQRRYRMIIHGVAALSNHYHALVTPESQKQLSAFMSLVNGKIAKEVGRLADWPQKVWSRPFEPIVVTNEEAAQVGRLAYLLAHGVKEGLVDNPCQWPGVHCAAALTADGRMEGLWFDRTREYQARRLGRVPSSLDFATRETLFLSPLPCWAHLDSAAQRDRVAELLRDITRDGDRPERIAARECRRTLLEMDPHLRPCRTKRAPAPRVHAATEAAREQFLDAYRLFLASRRARR
jgi:REP element-mobilizing transposase RayT